MVAVTGGQPIFSRRPHQKPQLPFHLITEELLLWDLCLLGKGRIGARGGGVVARDTLPDVPLLYWLGAEHPVG
jgi:hypothetical protein